MAENSKIEWTNHTFNPWIGCQKVGPGCDHCYAEAMMDKRLGRVEWGPHGARQQTGETYRRQPLAWDKAAAKAGRRDRVFCASLADWADTHSSIQREWRYDLGRTITATPNLIWLMLTKRIFNAQKVLAQMFPSGLPANVAIGITVVNQAEAERDIPKLLDLKARLGIQRVFLSVEPMLGPVDLTCLTEPYDRSFYLDALTGDAWDDENGGLNHEIWGGDHGPRLDWVICGGESGPGARPMHPDWPCQLRGQCVAADVPFFFKQWGEWGPANTSHHVFAAAGSLVDFQGERWAGRGSDLGAIRISRLGKTRAGRLLDGRTWDQMPEGWNHG